MGCRPACLASISVGTRRIIDRFVCVVLSPNVVYLAYILDLEEGVHHWRDETLSEEDMVDKFAEEEDHDSSAAKESDPVEQLRILYFVAHMVT